MSIIISVKKMRRYLIAIVTAIMFLPFAGTGQSAEPASLPDNQLLGAAREIMTAAGTCALITVDQEGRPRVREMDPFPPGDDFIVWFGTNPRSRKVEQIRNNPKVTLYYTETGGAGYVMICGTARLVNEQEEKDRRWKEEWKAFYPDKRGNYLLIQVTPVWLEVISYTHGITGDPVTWEPPKVVFERE